MHFGPLLLKIRTKSVNQVIRTKANICIFIYLLSTYLRMGKTMATKDPSRAFSLKQLG